MSTSPEQAATEDAWTLYAHHRARLTGAILESAPAPGGRLCLLGAGECNDVDLDRLAATFAEIHLVDVDPAALGRAVARQTPSVKARLRPHTRVDLSGILGRLEKWKRKPPAVAQVVEAAGLAIQSLRTHLPGPFDVVASVCVLTQMAFAVRDALGDAHPMLPAVRQSVVATHLASLIELTGVGGASLLVTDLSSSNLFPLARIAPERDLREAMGEIVARGVYYHAANPRLIDELLLPARALGRIGAPVLLDPWLWSGTLGRTYFVYAVRLPRRG